MTYPRGRIVSTLGSATNAPAASAIIDGAFNQCDADTALLKLFTATDPRETAKSITPVNPYYPFGWAPRYGIKGDGVTDNTAAMAIAHSLGVTIYYPPGTYLYTTISAGLIRMRGAGFFDTKLVTTDLSSSNSITQTTSAFGPSIADMELTPSGSKAGGYAVWFAPASGSVFNARVESVFSNNYPNGIGGTAWTGFVIDSECVFSGCTGVSVLVANAADADSGDSRIDALFTTSNETCVHILQTSSGGLKITGAKFLGGLHHYQLALSNVGNTGDLIVTGGSSEGAYGDHFDLGLGSGSSKTFTNVIFDGMEIEITSPANNNWGVKANDSSGFLSNIDISGCEAHHYNTGGGGFYVDYVAGGMIGDNILTRDSDLTAAGTGLFLGTNNTNVICGINQISGFTASIGPSNSPTYNQITPNNVQEGTTTIATTGAAGNVWMGQQTITFPTPFAWAPDPLDIDITIDASSGGIAAYAYADTGGAIAINATGQTSSTVVPIRWRAKGII